MKYNGELFNDSRFVAKFCDLSVDYCIKNNKPIYLGGDENQDGSWRMWFLSNAVVYETRENGIWNKKHEENLNKN